MKTHTQQSVNKRWTAGVSTVFIHGVFLTVGLTSNDSGSSSSTGCQGNRVLHGGAQSWVSTVTVAEASAVDIELGLLGGEG